MCSRAVLSNWPQHTMLTPSKIKWTWALAHTAMTTTSHGSFPSSKKWANFFFFFFFFLVSGFTVLTESSRQHQFCWMMKLLTTNTSQYWGLQISHRPRLNWSLAPTRLRLRRISWLVHKPYLGLALTISELCSCPSFMNGMDWWKYTWATLLGVSDSIL